MSGECDDCGEHTVDCGCKENDGGVKIRLIELYQAWGYHDLMVTAAHRYCLGRRTYIVSECVKWLIQNWSLFEKNTKKLIVEETKEALDKGWAGDACDVAEWNKIAALSIE